MHYLLIQHYVNLGILSTELSITVKIQEPKTLKGRGLYEADTLLGLHKSSQMLYIAFQLLCCGGH